MVYHLHGVGISMDQARKLAKHQRVRLSHSHLHGSQKIYLTKVQLNKLHHSHAHKKGMTLQFDAGQAKHNMMHGGGFWDAIAGAAKGLAQQAVSAGANYAGQQLGNAAQSALGQIPIIGAPLGSLAASGINAGLNAGANALNSKIAGSGIGIHRAPRRTRGRGIMAPGA